MYSKGFSLGELLTVLAVVAVLAALAGPRLARYRARASAGAARDAFVATYELARVTAMQYGSIARLNIDTAGNRFWLAVDTGASPGAVAVHTIGPPVLIDELFPGTRIRSGRRRLCLSPLGLATAAADCSLPNATIVFEHGAVAETAVISRPGRVRRP